MKSMTCMLLAGGLSCLAVAVLAGTPAQATTTAGPARVIVATPGLTLEEAVAEVQEKTHGKVLRAGTRQYGDTTEYRIKVLTPDGHVRVIPVRSRHTRPHQHKPEETH